MEEITCTPMSPRTQPPGCGHWLPEGRRGREIMRKKEELRGRDLERKSRFWWEKERTCLILSLAF